MMKVRNREGRLPLEHLPPQLSREKEPQTRAALPHSDLGSLTHPGGPHTKGSGTSEHSEMTKRETKPSVSAGTAGDIADLTWA